MKLKKNNDPDGGIWTAGQSIGVIDDCPSTKEIIDTIMQEATQTIKNRLQSML